MSDYQLELAFKKLEKVLDTLGVIIVKPMDADRRNIDATIQRFKFSNDLFWKLLKRILESKGVDVIYPKDVLKAAYRGDLIDQEEVWLAMLQDRNLTSHTYDEQLADTIFAHIQTYYPLLRLTFEKLQHDFASEQTTDQDR